MCVVMCGLIIKFAIIINKGLSLSQHTMINYIGVLAVNSYFLGTTYINTGVKYRQIGIT